MSDTPRVDQLLEKAPTETDLVDCAKTLEQEIAELKVVLNDAITGAFVPYMPASVTDLADADLARMANSCGWILAQQHLEPEAWRMWLDRLRRFAALVRQ